MATSREKDREQALELWLKGVNANTISDIIKVKMWTIYDWSARYNWPKRIKGKQRYTGATVMAAKLWLDGVPRVTVAMLCGISLTTLDKWRREFKWQKRRPGLRSKWNGPEGLQRAKVRAAHLEIINARKMQAEIEKVRRERAAEIRWRCDCGILHADLSCLVCRRKHPLAAA